MTDQHSEFIPAMRLENEHVWEAVQDRLRELVVSGRFILGPEVEEFEDAAAAAFECAWAVGTSSGTSALTLALRAGPLAPGSRVALPANTFFATLEAVVAAGMVPVVVDVDEDQLLALDLLEDLALDAVIPVHLFGLPVDMPVLMEMASSKGWWVLEDCSQAHGATIQGRSIGSFGQAAAFSAYPTKNLGAWGDAGFVTGSDPELRETIKALRHHGQRGSNCHEAIAGTDRLDSLQALVLREKLGRLPDEVAARRRVAGRYREALATAGLDLPGDRQERCHAYHQFVVRVAGRDEVRGRLEDVGIGTGIHYPTPVHLQPAAAGNCEVPRPLPVAERLAGEILSLPMYPGLEDQAVDRVSRALTSAIQ